MTSPTKRTSFVIRAYQPWWFVDWKGIYQYRELLTSLVMKDFSTRFKQTILGPAWFIINPLITTLTFTIVFGKVAGIPTGGVPPALFYLSGLVPWNYFMQVYTSSGETLKANLGLFSKVFFPRLIVPFAGAIAALLTFVVQLLTYFALYGFTKWSTPEADLHLTWGLVLMPVLLLQSAMIALGVGLILSCLAAKYRDLHHLTGFLLTIWQYASAIIVPFSRFPEKWRWLVSLNPMAAVVDGFRFALLGHHDMEAKYYFISGGITLVVFVLGIVLFQRTERTYVDYA